MRPTIHRNCFHAIRFNGISKFRRLHIERHNVARQSNAAGEYIVGLKDCSEPKGVVLATVQYMYTYVHVCNITLCLFRSSFHTQIIGKHSTETFSESVEIANFIVTILSQILLFFPRLRFSPEVSGPLAFKYYFTILDCCILFSVYFFHTPHY